MLKRQKNECLGTWTVRGRSPCTNTCPDVTGALLGKRPGAGMYETRHLTGRVGAVLRVFRNGVPTLTPVAGFTVHPQAGGWTPRPRMPNYRLLGKPMMGVL